MAMASPCYTPSSSLSSSPLSGACTCNSRQQIQVRWDIVKIPFLPLLRSGKSFIKMQQNASHNRTVRVHAEYDGRKGGGSGDFVAGFILGGVVFGALGYIFAPQVNKLLAGVDREREELPKKLPKGLDDDEGLEKTRRNLNEKIAQLNAAIDDVSSQLRADDGFGVPSGSTPEFESAS